MADFLCREVTTRLWATLAIFKTREKRTESSLRTNAFGKSTCYQTLNRERRLP
jgi:hypothetical protein